MMDLALGQAGSWASYGRCHAGDLGFSWQVVPITTDVGQVEFALHQITPTPFSARTSITYAIPHGPVPVFISVFNLPGGLVRTLVQESQSPGTFAVTWDERDDNGLNVHVGGYFTKFRAGGYQRTQAHHTLRRMT